MQIGSFHIPTLIPIFLFLAVFFYFAFKRRVRYEGEQETVRGPHKHMFTDNVTGSTFPSNSKVIGLGELAKRRVKFGKAAWSWPTTIVVLGLIGLALHELGVF